MFYSPLVAEIVAIFKSFLGIPDDPIKSRIKLFKVFLAGMAIVGIGLGMVSRVLIMSYFWKSDESNVFILILCVLWILVSIIWLQNRKTEQEELTKWWRGESKWWRFFWG